MSSDARQYPGEGIDPRLLSGAPLLGFVIALAMYAGGALTLVIIVTLCL